MNYRTDLAIELAQQLQDSVSQDYQTVQKEEDGAAVFHTRILTPEGERQFGKPEAAIENNAADKDAAVKLAVKKIDQACAKGILKKNTASRKKSKLAVRVNKSND